MNLEKRLEELRALSKRAAAARAERDYLEEFKKSKLAILMKKAESQGYPTAAAQEREARASDDYIDLLNGLRAATEISEQLEWQLRISLKGADLWQTQQANERAERRAYGA